MRAAVTLAALEPFKLHVVYSISTSIDEPTFLFPSEKTAANVEIVLCPKYDVVLFGIKAKDFYSQINVVVDSALLQVLPEARHSIFEMTLFLERLSTS